MPNEEVKKLNCRDCNSEFEFAVGEQLFYKDKEFPDPVRCSSCRKVKKVNQESKKQQHEKN